MRLRTSLICGAKRRWVSAEPLGCSGRSPINRKTTQPTAEPLQSDAIAALTRLIEAAAEAPNTRDVPGLYSRLLREIVTANRRSGDSVDLIAKCRPALGRSAANHSFLTTSLSAYRRATQEPLAWRRAFARQQAELLTDGFPSTNRITGATEQADKPNGGLPKLGSMRSSPETVAPMLFRKSADAMVRKAASNLTDASFRCATALRLTPTSRTVVTPIQNQCYVNSSLPETPDIILTDLRTALVVSDTHGPLSIEAADAVSSAEMHDYLAIGGRIREVHLESLVTRFATVPSAAAALIPVGQAGVMPRLVFSANADTLAAKHRSDVGAARVFYGPATARNGIAARIGGKL